MKKEIGLKPLQKVTNLKLSNLNIFLLYSGLIYRNFIPNINSGRGAIERPIKSNLSTQKFSFL